ncbi:opioid growth factor receptor-related protein [Lacrimispora amygdalina]|uniref:opioid growth factor receptor-related protein n=1 Tax=Lacrimispora amygdalina TaxID=253257 RepID=UPI000BE39B94|nr:opioid growth factor receptor-related protein [Lacrimispora amygdalina]
MRILNFIINLRKQKRFTYEDFFQNKARNINSNYLKDYWDMSNDELEIKHDYIQYMFPLYEYSKVEPFIPILTEYEMNQIKRDSMQYSLIQENIKKSFKMMLRFYGLKLEKVEIEKGNDFEKRKEIWINSGNHNYLRITRILKCLMIFEMMDEAMAFYRILLKLKEEYQEEIDDVSVEFWTEAIGKIDS